MINDISELITALWQREFSVTVELNMLKEDTEYKSTSEVENTKPQLRMVDLNLLTVFDAVMQEQNSDDTPAPEAQQNATVEIAWQGVDRKSVV